MIFFNKYATGILYETVVIDDSKSDPTDIFEQIQSVLTKDHLSGGFCIFFVVCLYSTSLFSGNKVAMIVLLMLIHLVQNIVWMCFSGIDRLQQEDGDGKYRIEQLNSFDKVMFHMNVGLAFTNFYLAYLLPIDVSKQYMLRENRRTYALIICFTCGMNYFVRALFFDEYDYRVPEWPFLVDRIVTILMLLVCVLLLKGMARKELREKRVNKQRKSMVEPDAKSP